MKKIILLVFILFGQNILAHHTKDHAVLLENTDKVIAKTQQGSIMGDWIWLVWLVVAILLFVGLYRRFRK